MKTDKPFEILLTISTGLLIIYAYPFKSHQTFLYCIIVFSILVLFIPPVAKLVVGAWNKLSEILGTISSTILLSLLFFFILSPIALMYRLLKKDKSKIKRNNAKSMFIQRNYQYTAKDLEYPW